MAKRKTNRHACNEVLREFIRDIENTGGVLRRADGSCAPAADEDWIDLGETYVRACAALRRQPKIKNEKPRVVNLRSNRVKIT